MIRNRSLTICLIISILIKVEIAVRSPFPKIIGGSTDNTAIFSLDYNEPSSQLVVGGYTWDPSIRSNYGGSIKTAIIVAYKGANLDYLWGNAIKTPVMTVNNIQYSPDGNTVVAFAMSASFSATANYVMVINALNGARGVVFSYPNSGYVDYTIRPILVESGAYPPNYGYFTTMPKPTAGSTTQGVIFFRFGAASGTFATSAPWVLNSALTTSTVRAKGLTFGESESILYAFSYTSTQCQVNRVQASTGTILQTFTYVGCPIGIGTHTFDSKYFSATSTQVTVAITSATVRQVWLIKEDLGGSTVLYNNAFTETSAVLESGSYMTPLAVMITGVSTCKILLLLSTNLYVASLDFSAQTATY